MPGGAESKARPAAEGCEAWPNGRLQSPGRSSAASNTPQPKLRFEQRGIRVRYESGVAEQMQQNVQPRRDDMPHILVVDDDPMVCMAIEVCLQRQGFEVTIADGGEAGVRALETATFDVMLVDIFMPHMRGFESIRIFHERAPQIPLIAMSGYAFAAFDTPSPDFLRMTLELGATVCLRKPFTPNALLAAVNACLAKPIANARFSQ
jgi:CheY-like chemotaxis protein